MNLLITGRGKSGSWKIRAEQLGAAMGAKVLPHALDIAAFDVVIAVKRPTPDLLQRIHRSGIPLIWDVVDAWPQPEGNSWARAECMTWLETKFAEIRPAGIVAATRAMASDCERFGIPVLALPHHARPGLQRNPIRESVRKVGYEGGVNYLGKWHPVIERECAARGWEFIINPESLSELDIAVAVRDADGYAPRHWKSNVKLANCQGSGTPCILNAEAGYLETASGVEHWVEVPKQIREAFDALKDWQTRLPVSDALLRATPKIEDIAKTYRTWLENFATASSYL